MEPRSLLRRSDVAPRSLGGTTRASAREALGRSLAAVSPATARRVGLGLAESAVEAIDEAHQRERDRARLRSRVLANSLTAEEAEREFLSVWGVPLEG